MSRPELEEEIIVELSRDEWIALLTAAFYGMDTVERTIGGNAFHIALQSLAYTSAELNIHSVITEAHALEAKQCAKN